MPCADCPVAGLLAIHTSPWYYKKIRAMAQRQTGGIGVRMDRKALKQAAKDNLRRARPNPMWVTLVYLLLTAGISQVVELVTSNPAGTIAAIAQAAAEGADVTRMAQIWMTSGGQGSVVLLFLTILVMLYGMVLSFGYHSYTLRRTDGEEAGFGTLLSGFTMVGRIILMNLVIACFTLAWTLLAVVPAAMLGGVVMVVMMILLNGSTLALVLGVLFLYGAILAGAVLAAYLSMRYAFAPFLLADQPELSGLEAVRRSRILLRDRLGEMFTLHLSFFGWLILQPLLLTAAVGLAVAAVWTAGAAPFFYSAAVLGGMIVGTLAVLPFQMWFVPYYYGTMAGYYRTVVSAPVEAFPEADRPEPF